MNDHTSFDLQKNIPLTAEDLAYIREQKMALKDLPKIMLGITLFVIAFIAWLIKDNLHKMRKDDVIFLIFGGIVMIGLVSGISWLIIFFTNKDFKKDILLGKNLLTSTLVYKTNSKRGTFFFFQGADLKETIKIQVRYEWFDLYPLGSQLKVFYLKHSNTILTISKIY
jgi:hypothetical protein